MTIDGRHGQPAPAVLPIFMGEAWRRLRELETERQRAADARRRTAAEQPTERLRLAEARRADEEGRKAALRSGGTDPGPAEEQKVAAHFEDVARQRSAAAHAITDIATETVNYLRDHGHELAAEVDELLARELEFVEQDLVDQLRASADKVATLEDWVAYIADPTAPVRVARRAALMRKLAHDVAELRASAPATRRVPLPPEHKRRTLGRALLKQSFRGETMPAEEYYRIRAAKARKARAKEAAVGQDLGS